MPHDEVAAIKATKAKAIAAYGDDRVLGVSNGGAGVWLTDSTYVPAAQIGVEMPPYEEAPPEVNWWDDRTNPDGHA